jgi:hypothetical protein
LGLKVPASKSFGLFEAEALIREAFLFLDLLKTVSGNPVKEEKFNEVE